MTDLKEAVKGNGAFVMGYFFVVITQYIFPTIFEVIASFTSDSIVTIGYFMSFIVWILAMAVIPNYWVIKAIQTRDNNNQPLSNIVMSVLYIIFTLVLLIAGWYIFPAMASGFEDVWLQSLFWISFIINLIGANFVAPINKIIANKSK